MNSDQILQRITEHYLMSGDFNGFALDDFNEDPELARRGANKLLLDGKIVLNFGDLHPNPHILAFEPEPTDTQIAKLNAIHFAPPEYEELGPFRVQTNRTNCCAYPSKDHLRTFVDVSQYEGKPYTLMLALGEPQLGYRAFNLRILEFYRNDPRYSYQTDDIRGHISVRGDKEVDPTGAFLIYLSRLTPEHQQRWKLEQTGEVTFLHIDYSRSSAGHWDTQESMFNAFCEELNIINKITIKIYGVPLLRNAYVDAKPAGFGFLIRPTTKEYDAFVQLLDKMMSDNLNKRFFDGKVDLTFREEKDGVLSEKQKGTITLLDDWLARSVRLHEPNLQDEMVATFKKVRQERGPLAHEVRDDQWNEDYFAKQRELMKDAYAAIRTLRLILAGHPAARPVAVPDWLHKAEIRTF